MAKNTGSAKSANTITGHATPKTNNKSTPAKLAPSAVIAANGVTDSRDFANLMSTLIGDVLTGRVSTDVANAAVNAGGKLLKVVEMQHKYGSAKTPAPRRLMLT